jgi:hypothetical protein
MQPIQLIINLISATHLTQSHQEIAMLITMETLNMLYHQDIMHLTQKI